MADIKNKIYLELYDKVKPVLDGTEDLISAMATVSCLIKEAFPDLLWVGFYRLIGEDMIVAPYQGSLGCTYIPPGKGVCGKAAKESKTLIVSDVHKFDGHIACNSRSKSEIVVPVFDVYGKIIAVLDVDSAKLSNFDEADRVNLEKIVKLLADKKIFV